MSIPKQSASDLEFKLSELMIHDEDLKNKVLQLLPQFAPELTIEDENLKKLLELLPQELMNQNENFKNRKDSSGQMCQDDVDLINRVRQMLPVVPPVLESRAQRTGQLGGTSQEMDKNFHKLLLQICQHFIIDMNNYGISVTDSFLGAGRGNAVYEEVIALHQAGLFQDGQLVRTSEMKKKEIRGDEILWLSGDETQCPNIIHLINEIDRIVMTSNKIPNNGILGKYKIDRRTKAMVACYPGNGSHYVKHVDNPNHDGRVLTAIYYLNKDWRQEVHGGMLRIFPNNERKEAADIAPLFDRMLFFWSDRRNPHEVQPSFRTRYAITIWYFDANERKLAEDIKSMFEESLLD